MSTYIRTRLSTFMCTPTPGDALGRRLDDRLDLGLVQPKALQGVRIQRQAKDVAV